LPRWNSYAKPDRKRERDGSAFGHTDDSAFGHTDDSAFGYTLDRAIGHRRALRYTRSEPTVPSG
jgi:hypothetical protein